jgi:hypothetical protein
VRLSARSADDPWSGPIWACAQADATLAPDPIVFAEYEAIAASTPRKVFAAALKVDKESEPVSPAPRRVRLQIVVRHACRPRGSITSAALMISSPETHRRQERPQPRDGGGDRTPPSGARHRRDLSGNRIALWYGAPTPLDPPAASAFPIDPGSKSLSRLLVRTSPGSSGPIPRPSSITSPQTFSTQSLRTSRSSMRRPAICARS